MQAGHYIHVLWVFIAGIALVIIGVSVMLIFEYGIYSDIFPEVGYSWQSISFVIMIMGLAIGGIGAIRGKRKLQGGLYDESPWFQDNYAQKNGKPKEAPAIPPQTGMSDQSTLPVIQPKPEQQEQPAAQPEEKLKDFYDMQKEEVHKPVNEAEILEEMNEIEHDIAPSDVVKIFVCPKCGFDNPEANIFCSKCGKKIQTKEHKEQGKKEIKKGTKMKKNEKKVTKAKKKTVKKTKTNKSSAKK